MGSIGIGGFGMNGIGMNSLDGSMGMMGMSVANGGLSLGWFRFIAISTFLAALQSHR